MASWRRKKKPDGTLGDWQVRWRDPDGRDRAKDVKTWDACKALVRVVQRCEDLGERYEPRGVRAEPTLGDAARAWLLALKSENEDSTIKAHAHRLDLFLRWLQSKKPRSKLYLRDLSQNVLREYHAEVDGFEGNPRVLATRNKYTRTVHQLWRWAHEDDDFAEFAPKTKTLKLKAPPAAHALALPWSEIDRVVTHAHGRHRDLLVMLRYTGLRVDQAMQLRWDDFDLAASTLYVRPEIGKTRTEKIGRLIPVSPHLVTWLAGLGRRVGYVLPAGKKQSREPRGRDVWRFWERAGIDQRYWKQRPHHAFRKAFETNLKAAGVDSEAVEFYVGHDLAIRGAYVDPWAQPLAELVKAIPEIGKATPPLRRVDHAWTKPPAAELAPAKKAVRKAK